MIFASVESYILNAYEYLVQVVTNPSLYVHMGAIVTSLVVSYLFSHILRKIFGKESSGLSKGKQIRHDLYQKSVPYLLPVSFVVVLSFADQLTALTGHQSWLISTVQTLTVLVIINRLLTNLVESKTKRQVAQILILPLVLVFFMGWLDEITGFLETYKLAVGNLTITLNGILKTIIFGILLFWLSKASNVKGQSFIRNRKTLDLRSKEVFAKLFEISLFVIFCILMLEIIGIDLTTLAIFGGALGLGLGFGLQSIASNFISGIILLLDRSLSVGDHIELEDGRQGIVRVLNMRSATIETYDGKDVLVPNEQFISSTFINWTHQNTKQRYALELQVAYSTDLHFLFELIRRTARAHPQILSGDKYPIEEQPDAEIASFGDSGINILIEFWMDGVDDGKNRVGADLLLMLWDAFKEHNITIPFPQREVNILNKTESEIN